MNTRTIRFLSGLFAASIALVLASAGAALAQSAKEKLTVRFTWKLKGEYAPLFVALDKGYFAAEGLEVDLAEGSGTMTVLQLVANGTENLGYGPAVAAAQAVSQGFPLKVVALYQTQAPIGLIAFPDTPLKTPKDLEGKRLAITTGETFTEILAPFARVNKVDLAKVVRVQMEGSARNTQFMARKVDVISSYLSNELPLMEKVTGVKFNVLKISDFGINLPGASYFVNNEFAKAKPETLKKLLRASAKGYVEANKNRKEAAEIMNKYMKVKTPPDVMEAQVKATMDSTNAPQGKPVGWQEERAWKDNLELLLSAGAIKQVKDLKLYFTNEFQP